MQEASHHGRIIREYREFKVGITQEELARRINRSRRTVVNIEQTACIGDADLRRALAWALNIPPGLLGLLEEQSPVTALLPTLNPLLQPQDGSERNLNKVVVDTFVDNLRMRLDLYYLSSLSASIGLDAHIQALEQQVVKVGSKSRRQLLRLLSHNYQLKGMIARDQLDYVTAEYCFHHASALAVEAESADLNALALARLAVLYIWQEKLVDANNLYYVARDITRRSNPGLRAFLSTAHAEVQGLLGDKSCLTSLSQARTLLSRVDREDDQLLLVHATRCSEKSIADGWSQCHTFLGKPDVAIESYEQLEDTIDPGMSRMRARQYIQYAHALYVYRDMSCCFYIEEGYKLAKTLGSQYNINRSKKLASQLYAQFPSDSRVQSLLRVVQS